MSALATLRCWWRAVVHRSRVHNEVEAEFASHLDAYADDLVRSGMDAAEARRKAQIDMGRADVQKEKYREAIGLRPFDEIGGDIRYGLRSLGKNPSFSLVAILSLALGIGATTAMFSLIYAVLIHPFPYADSGRIMNPVIINDENPQEFRWFAMNASQFETFRKAKSLEILLGFMATDIGITGNDVAENLHAIYMTENAGSFFGMRALLGRNIQPSDAAGGAGQPVVVLNYRFWQRHYQGDRGVLGRVLELDHKNYTIVGVMPRSFAFNDTAGTGDVYLPRSLLRESSTPPVHWPWIPWIKLKPGVGLAAADAELQAMVVEFAHEFPKRYPKKFHLALQPIVTPYEQRSGRTLTLLFAAVVILLVIGCANCSILLLARGTARRHELAIRAALGASRWRIVRQMLVESVVISLSGALLGGALAWWLAELPLQLSPQSFPPESVIRVNLPVLGFSIAVALLAGLGFGLAPALRLSSPARSQALNAASRIAGSLGGRRALGVLISFQIALTMMLLAAAGMVLGTFLKLLHTPMGYEAHHVMVAGIPLHLGNEEAWKSQKTQAGRTAYLEQLRERIAAVPGVKSAAIGSNATPPDSGSEQTFRLAGRSASDDDKVRVHLVSPEYFAVLEIPLQRGRLWSDSENVRGDGVALVNESFVRRFGAGAGVVGQQLRLTDLKQSAPLLVTSEDSGGWREILGIVGDARNDGVARPVEPAVYVPFSTFIWDWSELQVRTEGAPMALQHAVAAAVQSVNPDQQVSNAIPDLEDALKRDPEWRRQQLFSTLFGIFSAMGLAVALVGLFSVVSYSVAQKTNEFGIRIALGASRVRILWAAARDVIVSVACGIAVGLLANAAMSRMLTTWLSPTVRVAGTFAGMTVMLAVCAALACLLPARRATSVDPIRALRYE